MTTSRSNSSLGAERFRELVAEAEMHNDAEWREEEARWSKSLYVGSGSEHDRRSIHGEAARSIKAAHRFWAAIPAEYRQRVATAAGLPITAIPEDLRAV